MKLKTLTSVKVLQKLPAEALTSLQITFLKLETKSHEEIEQLAVALSRFTQLESLILVDGLRYFPTHWWNDLHDGAFSKFFINMKKLEEVDIRFPFFEQGECGCSD